MENEVNDGIRITLNLVIIAAIVAIIVGFGVYTQQFKRDQINAISDSQLTNVTSEWREIESYGAVPVPTIYALLLKSDGAAFLRPVTVYDIAISRDVDLASSGLLGKKVKIKLTPVGDRYEVTIREEKEE